MLSGVIRSAISITSLSTSFGDTAAFATGIDPADISVTAPIHHIQSAMRNIAEHRGWQIRENRYASPRHRVLIFRFPYPTPQRRRVGRARLSFNRVVLGLKYILQCRQYIRGVRTFFKVIA